MKNQQVKLSVTAEIRIKEEVALAEGISAIQQFCVDMNSEIGCDLAVAHQSKDDPRNIILWEVYKDQEAFQAHFEAAHTQAFFEKGITELNWASESYPLDKQAVGAVA
ncbi:antibiotic biosynthesis monooxygenase [Vibrio sp. Of7-15]|uniref:putative quinol monooxygenase n=1 Tax=Vibrio sp. Of7-15 TaxID=2724879 RepID=UPI001EF232E1|nr:antibiotic biosynthesis monooxygenase [Vibrio sp. Of7-15]MCG7495419.1 antibiotic biosynthesis monooxygenase [Vibrio sp. Of7-15]